MSQFDLTDEQRRNQEMAKRRREQALADIANARWTLPADWKFDRDEANAR